MSAQFDFQLKNYLDAIYARRRNMLANGSFIVDTLNDGAALAWGAATIPADVWRCNIGTAGVVGTTQQISSILTGPLPANLNNHMALTCTAGAAPAAADLNAFQTAIEGHDCVPMGWGTLAARPLGVGFWVFASAAGMYSIAAQNGAADRSFVTNFTVIQANTWEYKVVFFPGCTDGTWAVKLVKGIVLVFDLGCGSNFETTTPNTWVVANKYRVASNAKFVGQAGTLKIAGVQVMPDYVDQLPLVEDISLTVARCRRYHPYYSANSFLMGQAIGAGAAVIPFSLGVTARTAITGVARLPTGAGLANAGGGFIAVTGHTFVLGNTETAQVQATVAAGLVAGNASTYQLQAGKIVFSGAELA